MNIICVNILALLQIPVIFKAKYSHIGLFLSPIGFKSL